jgi:bla regulator protein blaR1
MRSLIAAPIAKPGVAAAIEQIAQPFQASRSYNFASAPTGIQHFEWLPGALISLWVCGVLLIAGRWVRAWMRIRAVVRTATPTTISANVSLAEDVPVLAGVPVLCSDSLLEPGAFGILRPVLLLPKGIVGHLRPEQLRAILEHEICHVRRRDNLTFALHMVVQVLFWYHPLIWWIGARLIEERERACDEAVLQAGGEAEVYAEGILSVCKFYVESPLSCSAGVSGSDLKTRITRIMSSQMTRQLNLTRKMLLGAAGFAIVLLPFSLGLVRTALAEERAEDSATKLPNFEVVSVKPHEAGDRMTSMRLLPDGIIAAGLPLKFLVRLSFGISDDRILNEPSWVGANRFDINAKVGPADSPKLKGLEIEKRWAMMLPVLEDRFSLKFHREMRDLQVYTLVVTKGGSKMQPAKNSLPNLSPVPGRVMMRFSQDEMSLATSDGTMESLTQMISQQIGSTVLDKTGLSGKYEFSLHWIPEHDAGPMMLSGAGIPANGEAQPDNSGVSLFTALQEQLGLKLVSQRVPVEVVVIDHIQQPSPN